MEKSDFYTLKGYHLKNKNIITESMEDYIEMIYRKTKGKTDIRISELSLMLNVRSSSVSKMMKRLRESGLVEFNRYGTICLTKEGTFFGNYFYWRHHVLMEFLRYLNHDDDCLEQVEKIEHFIDYKTLINMEKYLKENFDKK